MSVPTLRRIPGDAAAWAADDIDAFVRDLARTHDFHFCYPSRDEKYRIAKDLMILVVFDGGRIIAIGRDAAALTQLLDGLVEDRRAA